MRQGLNESTSSILRGGLSRAATPLEGPASRIAFDPSRRTFAPLLPSIRVELDNEAQLESITELVGATRAVFFEKLGFAIIDLPETLHPLQAISRLESVSGLSRATIRLRGPANPVAIASRFRSHSALVCCLLVSACGGGGGGDEPPPPVVVSLSVASTATVQEAGNPRVQVNVGVNSTAHAGPHHPT